MIHPALRMVAVCVLAAAITAAVWLVLASCIFLAGSGLWGHPGIHFTDYLWGWVRYLAVFGKNTTVTIWLVVGAVMGGLPVLTSAWAFLRWRWRRFGGLRGLGHRLGIDRIQRASSNTHGSAQWMPDDRIEELFPPYPHPELGGIVVGERSRDDLTSEHSLTFNPKNQMSWGVQGKGELMFDHCQRGTTHNIVVGGGGAFKSTTLTTTLLHWLPSMVVQDPAGELYDKVAAALEADGKTVIKLDLGLEGPNVLEAVDLTTPKGRLLADTRLRSVVARIIGPMPKEDSGNASRFKSFGRSIILALLADLVYRQDVLDEDKSLRTMRRGLDVPDKELREILRGIYRKSPSQLARSMAANVMDQPEETWGGSVSNAKDDTEWLASDAYANLVSGSAFRMKDIVKGKHAIFSQIPQEVLEVTPALSRVLIGGMLDAVFSARGRVRGRVGFFLDEAVLCGPERSLKIARDQGRKYKITMQLFYQSEGQIEDVWGKNQKNAWFDGLSFRSYTRIQNTDTAKDLVTFLGTYGAVTQSKGRSTGRSGKPMEMQSSQRGDSAQESEVARELAKPHELLQEMRANERITIVSNDRPIRHTSAIDFCRSEILDRLGVTNYQTEFSDEDLEELEEAV